MNTAFRTLTVLLAALSMATQSQAQALGVMYERHSIKRSRVELRGGYWDPSGRSMANTGGLVRQSVENVMGSIAYTYQLNANLALVVRWAVLIAEVEQNVGILSISQDVV